MAVNLTPGAISKLMTGTCYMNPVVQVIDIKITYTQVDVNVDKVLKRDSYIVWLSDGSIFKECCISIGLNELVRSKKMQKGSIVQLTQFSCSGSTDISNFDISVHNLNVIRCKCKILGDPKPFSGKKAPSVNEPITLISDEDDVDPDVNDDRHHADEHTTLKQKCSSCSQTQSRKRQRQSSDDKEDDEINACFEKLEKLGWGEGPMYDTAVLLFGESSGYRKIWLHLKPKSCVNWVQNAVSKYGLLG